MNDVALCPTIKETMFILNMPVRTVFYIKNIFNVFYNSVHISLLKYFVPTIFNIEIKITIEITVNVMHLNHPSTPATGLWKNSLPRNCRDLWFKGGP